MRMHALSRSEIIKFSDKRAKRLSIRTYTQTHKVPAFKSTLASFLFISLHYIVGCISWSEHVTSRSFVCFMRSTVDVMPYTTRRKQYFTFRITRVEYYLYPYSFLAISEAPNWAE